MKNIFETFAIMLVGFLSLFLVYLVIEFNLINDDEVETNIAYEEANATEVKENHNVKINRYLLNMEAYSDKDVAVDATQEDKTNSVQVISELTKDKLTEAINSDDKDIVEKEGMNEIGLALDEALAD
jgi:hypothetical protein